MPEIAPDYEGVPGHLAAGVLDAIDDHVAVLDGSGRIVLVNEAWSAYGRSDSWSADRSPAGSNYLGICREAGKRGDEHATALAEALEAIIEGRQADAELEYPCKTPDAEQWWVCTASRMGDVDEPMVVVVHHDVTERRRRQERVEELADELERSNEELVRFAHTVSHDLKQPIRTVHQFVQLLDRNHGDELSEAAREYVEHAIEGADRAVELIDSLLELARVDSKAGEREPTDLGTVVDNVIQDLSVRIDETDAAIEVGEMPTVVADEDQVGDLFGNLIRNAIDYSGDAPPRIEISATRDDDRWQIAVADEGIGIAEEEQSSIFEAFERGGADHHPDGGSGIGLAIARRIVERHDGRIWVESTPGEGATFHFTLPAADGEEE